MTSPSHVQASALISNYFSLWVCSFPVLFQLLSFLFSKKKKCNNTLKHLEFELDDVNKASCRSWLEESFSFRILPWGCFLGACLFVFLPLLTVPFPRYFAPWCCSECSKLLWLRWGQEQPFAVFWCWSSRCFLPDVLFAGDLPNQPVLLGEQKQGPAKATKWAWLPYRNVHNGGIPHPSHCNAFWVT